MGSSIKHSSFSDEDYQAFSHRLQQNLQTLADLLKHPEFGQGAPSLGAELELSLIDGRGQAQWINQQLIELANDTQLTLELNQYNLEYNLSHLPAKGACFSGIGAEIKSKLCCLDRLAEPFGVRSVAIGILPTLRRKDIGIQAMSDFLRYRVLTESIKAMRGSPFEININGPDPLKLTLHELNAEGANTSFQVHLRVNPQQFTDHYNAAQMAVAPALAVSTNSPLFLGHRLWEETRVPLFKQAVETRNQPAMSDHRTARTGLGSGWVRNGALELFQRSVNDFAILLPECGNPAQPGNNRAPELFELRLHHGSIWHWNRAIYDPADGGHLRIEMRILPSGPSIIDMIASAAFMVGLTKSMARRFSGQFTTLPFKTIKGNFYRAAELGLTATLLWPDDNGKLIEHRADRLIQQLLPLAREGLDELGVDPRESEQLLKIVAQRAERQITGARWQLHRLDYLEQSMPRPLALQAMLADYLKHFDSGKPVHLWSIK